LKAKKDADRAASDDGAESEEAQAVRMLRGEI